MAAKQSHRKIDNLWALIVSIWWTHQPPDTMNEATLRHIARLVCDFKAVTYNPVTKYHETEQIAERRRRLLAGPMIVPDEPECLVANWGWYGTDV